MTIESVIRLLIALCIALEVRPEDLAACFAQNAEIQAYYDRVLELASGD